MTKAQWQILRDLTARRLRKHEDELRKLPKSKPQWIEGQRERIKASIIHRIIELKKILLEVDVEIFSAGREVTTKVFHSETPHTSTHEESSNG